MKRRSIETDHCKALMEWAAMLAPQRPELGMLFHIPNGSHKSKAAAGIMKAMGLKAGVWDYLLPVPMWNPFSKAVFLASGLWIEMKAPGNGLSEKQKEWGELMRRQRYVTKVCYSWEEASREIIDYLNGHIK